MRMRAMECLGRSLAAAILAMFGMSARPAESQEVKVGLIAPLSGPWGRQGQFMQSGAELAVQHINDQGGIRSLGGAKLKLIAFDAGDSTEKAKNAAQRMVAQEPDLVAGTGASLSSFTLAVTEVTERSKLPFLTLSYSDAITDRGFKYVFQTSATGAVQARESLPELLKMARLAGAQPQTVGVIMDNASNSYAFMRPMKEGEFEKNGLKLVMEEVYTPPLADATSIVQRIRGTKPDLLILLPSTISDVKLLLEKMNEFGLGQGKIPLFSNGSSIIQPDLLGTMDPGALQGIMTVSANWGAKGQEKLLGEFKSKFGWPFVVQEAISTYGDIWIVKEALERAGKADKEAVADAVRTLDLKTGPSAFFPGGRIAFDEKGRRKDAKFLIVQWQSGVPVTVYPPESAAEQPFWPKR